MNTTANTNHYETPGYALAMRVMQSDLYPMLDGRERAECDELIRIGQAAQAPSTEPSKCEVIADCTTPTLCLSVGTCKGYWVMPESVRASATPPAVTVTEGASPTDAQIDAAKKVSGSNQNPFEAGCEVLAYLREHDAPYGVVARMLICLHQNNPDAEPRRLAAHPAAGAVQGLTDAQIDDALEAWFAGAEPVGASHAQDRERMRAAIAATQAGSTSSTPEGEGDKL